MLRFRFLPTLFLLAVALTAVAETPEQTLNRAINAITKAGTIQANYSLTCPQGSSTGTIVGNGNKFRLLSNDVKCWYDGKTQWTYAIATGEVNIVEPSAAELAANNPYIAAKSLKGSSTVTAAKQQSPGCKVITLTPKQRNDIQSLTLFVADKTGLVQRALITMRGGSTYDISISAYKTHLKLPESTFVFDKKLVPPGTPVVDLR